MKKMSLGEMKSLSREEMKKIMAGSGTFKCCNSNGCSSCVNVCSGCTATCQSGSTLTGC